MKELLCHADFILELPRSKAHRMKTRYCQGLSEASFDVHLRISSCNARLIVMKDETL
ncbi:MAG: hypothetical protein ACLT07_00110 [Clostridia bacterium]